MDIGTITKIFFPTLFVLFLIGVFLDVLAPRNHRLVIGFLLGFFVFFIVGTFLWAYALLRPDITTAMFIGLLLLAAPLLLYRAFSKI